MNEKSKNAVFRVFQTANYKSAKFILGLIMAALGTLISAIPFYAVYRIINIFLTASLENSTADFQSAWNFVYLTLISIVIGIVFTIIGSILCHLSAFDVIYKLRITILEHLGKLNLGYHTTGSSGGVQKMMEENMNKMEEIVAHSLPDMVGAFLLFIALIVLLIGINPILTVIVIVATICAFIIQALGFGGKKGQQQWARLNRSITEMDAGFSEYIKGMEEEKIFGNPKNSAMRLTKKIEANRRYILDHLKRNSPFFGIFKITTLSFGCFILFGGAILLYFNQGNYDLMMQIIMCLVVVPCVSSPLMELTKMGAELKDVATRLQEIEEVLDTTPMQSGKCVLDKKYANVKFEDVSFSYQDFADPLRRMALSHINMEFKPRTFTALVGPSGGGKSTAGQLLARFWDIEGGTIFIEDIDIRDYKTENLMSNIAFVFQDTHIFVGSIFDNIKMNQDVSKEDVITAAKAARCHEFVTSFPNRYDTKVGDGGHKLSGGEAQRIAIARAILKNAPIVILDEAMAFTDAENELALREAISTMIKDKTVVMIAHRLYSIQEADNIYVLDDGKIAEQGKHEELLSKKGLYAHLWNIQNESSEWKLEGGEVYA